MFAPMGPVLTEMKNIRKNDDFFHKTKILPLRIVQRNQQFKFERNPCIKFRDNCDTDRRTDDGHISIL